MKIDVIIPSNKNISQLKMQCALHSHLIDVKDLNFIPTGNYASASVNRNFGLYSSESEYIIMMDDDIGGFYENWFSDLIEPLTKDPSIKLVSARLLTPEGELSPMMGATSDLSDDIQIVHKAVLSACIAFRRSDVYRKIWFDNQFLGSGFEDTLFCHHLMEMYPEGKIVVNNRCQLIHYHEMKEQSKYFEHNRSLFLKKCTDSEINNAVKRMVNYA